MRLFFVTLAALALGAAQDACGEGASTSTSSDPPGLCNVWGTNWNESLMNAPTVRSDARAELLAFRDRIPPTCVVLRGQIERYVDHRYPAPALETTAPSSGDEDSGGTVRPSTAPAPPPSSGSERVSQPG